MCKNTDQKVDGKKFRDNFDRIFNKNKAIQLQPGEYRLITSKSDDLRKIKIKDFK